MDSDHNIFAGVLNAPYKLQIEIILIWVNLFHEYWAWHFSNS